MTTLRFSNLLELNRIQQSCYVHGYDLLQGFPDGSANKESTCSAGDTGDTGLIHRLGTSANRGSGYPLQFSPEKSHGPRSLADHSPQNRRVGHD